MAQVPAAYGLAGKIEIFTYMTAIQKDIFSCLLAIAPLGPVRQGAPHKDHRCRSSKVLTAQRCVSSVSYLFYPPTTQVCGFSGRLVIDSLFQALYLADKQGMFQKDVWTLRKVRSGKLPGFCVLPYAGLPGSPTEDRKAPVKSAVLPILSPAFSLRDQLQKIPFYRKFLKILWQGYGSPSLFFFHWRRTGQFLLLVRLFRACISSMISL